MTAHASAAAAEFIQRRTGLTFPEARRRTLEEGVARVVDRHRIPPDSLLDRLQDEPGLLDELVAEITVGETHFFRHSQQFAVIRNRILPELALTVPDRPLRLWSAGCATGEEPYTLAILARELGLEHRVRILATDLSRQAFRTARTGRYRQWSLRGTPPEAVTAHFRESGDEFELDPEVRALVEFRYLNLAEDVYPTLSSGVWQMDLVMCRNVLIYFDAQSAAAVAGRLLASLSDAGWLFVGASDPFLSETIKATVVPTEAGLAYRRTPAPPGWSARFGGGHPRPSPVSARTPRAALAPRRPAASAAPARPAPPLRTDPLDEARAQYSARQYEDVIALLEPRRHAPPGTPEVWVLLVRALANLGRLQEAARLCTEAVEHHPAAAELAYLEAVLLIELGRHADAARSARRTLYLDRGYVMAHLALGGALTRIGDHTRARRAYRNAAALLGTLPPDATVAGSDGEPAGRLLLLAKAQQDLLEDLA